MKKTLLTITILLIAIRLIGSNLKNEQKLIVDTIYSKSLQENRLISVYLPPSYDRNKVYPVVFATDGQLINTLYKKGLDSLIKENKLPDLIMIGSFSNEKLVEGTEFSYRNYEYIKNWGENSNLNALFDKHFTFFTEELIKYVEQNYSISKERKNRYFLGCSNGAGFGVTLSVQRPDLISSYICFSMAGGRYYKLKGNIDDYPFIDLLYGDKEPFPLTMQIVEFDKYLTQKGYKHSLTVYEGGHDREIWRQLFFKRLEKLMNK